MEQIIAVYQMMSLKKLQFMVRALFFRIRSLETAHQTAEV